MCMRWQPTRRSAFLYAVLLLWPMSGRAVADIQAYYFEGTTTTSAIDGVPVFFNESFRGSFSYDTLAELTDLTTSTATYVDPGGSLQVAFNEVSFSSLGGLTISITRIRIPPINVSINTLRFSAAMVVTQGTAAAIEQLSLTFFGPNELFSDLNLPEVLDTEQLNGSLFIAAPDLVVPFPEPPRTGFISGQFDTFFPLLPSVVSLSVNGQPPDSEIVETPGVIQLFLTIVPGSNTSPLAWFFIITIEDVMFFATPDGGCTTNMEHLLISPPLPVQKLLLVDTEFPRGTEITFSFFLVREGIVAGDTIKVVVVPPDVERFPPGR